MIQYVLFFIIGVSLAIFIDIPFVSSLIFPATALLSAYVNRHEPNILHLCLGLFVIAVLERIVFLFVPTSGTPQVWVNNRIYILHFLFDAGFLLFLVCRGAISRFIYQRLNKPTKGLHLTNADISLFAVMVLFILLDLAALIENLLRNLEHMGFSEEFAKPLWELNWVFYNYPQMKSIILGIQFFILWSTLSCMFKQKSKYQDKFEG